MLEVFCCDNLLNTGTEEQNTNTENNCGAPEVVRAVSIRKNSKIVVWSLAFEQVMTIACVQAADEGHH